MSGIKTPRNWFKYPAIARLRNERELLNRKKKLICRGRTFKTRKNHFAFFCSQWRNEVNCRPGWEWKMPPPTKKEKKEQKKTQKAGMHQEYSIEKWSVLSPLCILIQITNQCSCVNLRKLRCSTAINLQINSNQLVLRSSINNTRVT